MRRGLDLVYAGSGWLAGVCLAAILVMTLLQVLGGISDLHVRGTDAYAGYAMAASSFLGLASTLRRGEHIRVTLFLQRLEGPVRRLVELWCLAVAILLSGFFAWYAWDMVYWSWEFDSRSDSMDASPLWIPQSAMAVGVSILTIAFLDEAIAVLGGRSPEAPGRSPDAAHSE